MQIAIENIWYKKNLEEEILYLCGYGYDTQGNPLDIELKDGQEDIDFEFHRINRLDVQMFFAKQSVCLNSGFNLVVKNPALKDILNVIVDGHTVQSYTKEELEGKKEENSIVLKIDHAGILVDNKNLTMINGWAFSISGKPLSYSVLDSANNPIDFSYRQLLRQDVEDNGYVDHAHRFCGFQIVINSKDAQAYKLVVSDGESTIEQKYEEDPSQKGNLVMSYVRRLNLGKVKKALVYLKNHGVAGFIERLRHGPGAPEDFYHDWFLAQRINEAQLEAQRNTKFSYNPKISILVPTFNTPRDFLEEMVQSVIQQSYPNWELCIADGSHNDTVVEYVKQCNDARIKIKKLDQNYGISGNTNEALSLATGDYIGLYDHDDLLEYNALYEIVNCLQAQKYDILYTDEDKLDNEKKKFVDPNFKPDYSEELLMSHNYITHFFVVNKEILNKVGGFRQAYDGAQDYDLILRCCEQTSKIHHIPKVLYHWRMHSLSTAENPESKMYCYDAGKRAIEGHLERTGLEGSVEMLPKPYYGLYHTTLAVKDNPLVSIIIPNKDAKETLKTCVDSLLNNNTYKNIEILIVENNSTEAQTFDYYKEIEEKHENIHILYYEGDFNYSRINNFGVQSAKGDYLLFLNNDTEVIEPSAIEQMLGYCMKEDVGIVGAKLLYGDNTIQHAGVVVGFGGYAGHVFHGLPKDNLGFMMRPILTCNYSAVTAACLLSKKTCFEQVQGFDETFKVAGNDIDYCLKVRELGYSVVYNAFALWHHYESKTRGYENTLEKVARFDQEVERFQDKWKTIIEQGDPYYNTNFDIKNAPYQLY